MKTHLIIALLFVFTGLNILQSCNSSQDKETKNNNEKNYPLVSLFQIKLKPFKHEIKVQGNVETEKDVLLNSEMGGLINSISVKPGDLVSQGQTIATVDASILASNVEELKTQLNYAEFVYEKQKELSKRGVGSEFDLEMAKNQVESIKARLNSLNTQKGKAFVKAPFAGVIDQVFAKDGQMVGPQSPIVRIVNNNSVDIVAMISEKHLSKMVVGTPIRVSFPNFKDTSIYLKITSIGNYIEPTNRTFRIMSKIKDNKLLLPNMLAEVHITDRAVDNGLVIPTKSIQKDQDNRDFIFVATMKSTNYVVEKIYIEPIENYNGETLIKANNKVNEGNFVVVNGSRGITDKDTVRTK